MGCGTRSQGREPGLSVSGRSLVPEAMARSCKPNPAANWPPAKLPFARTRVRLSTVPASATSNPSCVRGLAARQAAQPPGHDRLRAREAVPAKAHRPEQCAWTGRRGWSGTGPTAAQPIRSTGPNGLARAGCVQNTSHAARHSPMPTTVADQQSMAALGMPRCPRHHPGR